MFPKTIFFCVLSLSLSVSSSAAESYCEIFAFKESSPTELIKAIFENINCPNLEYNSQYDLVKESLKNGADANKINSFSKFPTDELINMLLNAPNSLEINRFLSIVLHINCKDDKSLAQQNHLIELALRKGADFEKFTQIKDEFKFEHKFSSREQTLLEFNLAELILEHCPSKSDIASHLKTRGYCYGFTTLWLYSKWLQFKQPQKIGGYNKEYDKSWFDNIVRKISLWQKHKKFNQSEIYDFEKFAEQIDFFQSPKYYIEGFRPADTKIHEADNRLTTDGKILKERYKIASKFTSSEQLVKLLKLIIHEDTLIYVIYSSNDVINNPGHYAGLFKHDDKYYFYDVRNSYGETRHNSIEEVANDIFILGSRIGFIICDFGQDDYSYPSQKSILDKIHLSSITPQSLVAAGISAIMTRSPESLRYFLDLGLSPIYKTKENISLLEMAVRSNSADIVKMLLKEPGVDQNVSNDQGTTCLHTAAAMGYFEVVKALLDDPRTLVDQKDSQGKTALYYAIQKKHNKTISMLQIHNNNVQYI